MSDIFSEVDEDVRKDKSLELWKVYGKYVIGAAVCVVATTAAVVGWNNYQLTQAQSQGRQMESASKLVSATKFAEASEAYAALAANGSKGYQALARLRQASALIAAGNGTEGVAVYDALAASDADEEFKAAAKIMAGYYLIDNGTPEQVRARVTGVETAGNIWASSAQELLALSALKEGKKDEAIKILSGLKDDANAVTGVKARATQLLQALGEK
ncbi:MAG: tetratricopeptide repeat protein [Sneathiella sp.]|nr:tetratricopeptide repeat protein [Sneathiella sp.]